MTFPGGRIQGEREGPTSEFIPESSIRYCQYVTQETGEENGNPLQYSCLENPTDRGACGLQSMGVTRAGHDLATKPPSYVTQKSLHNQVREFYFQPPDYAVCYVPGSQVCTVLFQMKFSLCFFLHEVKVCWK